MKRKLFFTITSVTILFSSIALGDGHIYSEWDFALTASATHENNRCSRGYSKLKKTLKEEAKNYCAREHGSHGMKMFKAKSWQKISCTKKKHRGEKTTVHVKGTYRAVCK